MPLEPVSDASGEDARAQMRTVAYILRVVAHTMPSFPAGVDPAKETAEQLRMMAADLELGTDDAKTFFENARKRAMQADYASQQSKGITVVTDGDLRAAMAAGLGSRRRRRHPRG